MNFRKLSIVTAVLMATGAVASAETLSIGFADPVSSADPQLNNHAGDRSLALHFWDSIINWSRRGANMSKPLAASDCRSGAS